MCSSKLPVGGDDEEEEYPTKRCGHKIHKMSWRVQGTRPHGNKPGGAGVVGKKRVVEQEWWERNAWWSRSGGKETPGGAGVVKHNLVVKHGNPQAAAALPVALLG